MTAVELKRTEHERPSCTIEIKPVVFCLANLRSYSSSTTVVVTARLHQEHGSNRRGGSGKGSGNAVSAEGKSVDVCLGAGACLQFVKTKQSKEEKRGEKAMAGVRLQADKGRVAGSCQLRLACPPRRTAPAVTHRPRPCATATRLKPLLQRRRSWPLPNRAALGRACRCSSRQWCR